MIGCIVIAENECDGRVHRFGTQELADAFCEGVGVGAGYYGCGSCIAVTRHDLKVLDPHDKADKVVADFIAKYLPEEQAT